MDLYGVFWRAIRNSVVRRDSGRCQDCGATKGLVVHHRRPLRMGGDHRDYNLVTLCRSCHGAEHAQINQWGLAFIPGEESEKYRYYLTDKDAVLRFAEHIESNGLDASYMREVEKNRP